MSCATFPAAMVTANLPSCFCIVMMTGAFWFQSVGGLLTLYDGQRVAPFPTGADEYFKKNEVYVSTLLKDGSLCVSTLHGGAVIVEHDGKLRQIIDKPGWAARFGCA